MTTEPARPPARRTGATNLRPYLVAVLASAYVIAWWRFAARASTSAAAEPPTSLGPAGNEGPPPLVAWFHDLPAELRPTVDLPAGWHIADPATARTRVTRRVAPVPVRVPSTRAGRVRTRSS
ncbi:MAG: hypothetical protein R3B48_28165 [Kofleriaceae bacterium]